MTIAFIFNTTLLIESFWHDLIFETVALAVRQKRVPDPKRGQLGGRDLDGTRWCPWGELAPRRGGHRQVLAIC